MESGTGTLPVGFRGIGILPMLHGLEAHATRNGLFIRVLRDWRDEAPVMFACSLLFFPWVNYAYLQ
jgi:hypothetical protein